jgi:hypothetical protein
MEYYDSEEWAEMCDRFADPGGNSALYPATEDDPRIFPCPTCLRKNMLTRRDVAKGYQCDICADAAEGIGSYGS